MAKTSKTPDEAQEVAPAPADASNQAAEDAPRLHIAAQYIRDFSFENPAAPNFRTPEGETPEMKVNVNVSINKIGDDEHEVALKFETTLMHKETKLFICELEYCSIVRLQNIPEQNIEPILLIEVPRQLFPFARKALHDITRDGGWPPLLLDPIDFAQLYQARVQANQAQAEENGADTAAKN